jgi:recombination DNA repair RAD52 pathway protein
MSYQVEIAKNGRYLICRVSRPVTTDLARQFSMAMDQVSRAHNIKRFLVDVRGAPNVATVFQNYEYANKDMGSLDLQRDVRSAILVDCDDHSHDFVETVTQNAGYVVRVFDDESAAIAWLEETN